MHTWFEIVLPDPTENRLAAAEAALDEIERVEGVLSRFAPASETWRVNREAAQQPVRLSVELAAVLARCRDFWRATEGHFDVTAGSGTFAGVELDAEERRVFFREPGLRLDFGAVGKGYALDRAAQVLQEVGVTDALLHGGTSSVRALGHNAGQPWRVTLRDWPGQSFCLSDTSLSVSGAREDNQKTSDVINPHANCPLDGAGLCAVQAEDGLAAEAWSTALLVMGPAVAEDFCRSHPEARRTVLFHIAGAPALA